MGRWILGRAPLRVNGSALAFVFVTSVTFVFSPFTPVFTEACVDWVTLVAEVVWLICGAKWVLERPKQFFGTSTPSTHAERIAVGKA